MIATVEDSAEALARLFEHQSTVQTRRLGLSFYERQRAPAKPARAPSSWFGAHLATVSERERPEERPWEVWTIEVTVAPSLDDRARARLAEVTRLQLANFQMSHIRFCNENRAHVPSVRAQGLLRSAV